MELIEETEERGLDVDPFRRSFFFREEGEVARVSGAQPSVTGGHETGDGFLLYPWGPGTVVPPEDGLGGESTP